MKISVSTINAKDGTPILQIEKDEKVSCLNSTYNPTNEVELYCKQFDQLTENTILFIFGFGNGLFKDKILEKTKHITSVIFFEPCDEIFQYNLINNQDIYALRQPKRYMLTNNHNPAHNIFCCQDIPLILNNLNYSTNQPSIKLYALPKYKELFSTQYQMLKETISNYVERAQTNINTARAIGEIVVRNNIRLLKYLPDLDSTNTLINAFPKDLPAIIVSAGPSLESCIESLKLAKNKALILCVDKALNNLLNHNIQPDFIISVDPRKDLKIYDDPRVSNIPLLGSSDMNISILERIKPNSFSLITTENPFIQELFSSNGHEIHKLKSAGSVANVAMSLCIELGFKKIIFVGQDLALTNMKQYAENTTISIDTTNSYYLQTEDIYGNPIYTTRDYYMYLKWFETEIQNHPDITFIDAKNGGALIKGSTNMSLEKALQLFATKEYNITDIIQSRPKVFINKLQLQASINKYLNSYQLLESKLEHGLILSDNAINICTSKSNKEAKLLEINKELAKLCDYYEQSDCFHLVQREIDATSLDAFIEIISRKVNPNTKEHYQLMKDYLSCIKVNTEKITKIINEGNTV